MKSIYFSTTRPKFPHFMDFSTLMAILAIGISVATSNYDQVDFISVYAPNSDFSPEDITNFFYRQNPFVIAGDFNAHHDLWERNARANRGGSAIQSVLMDHPDATLVTPRNMPTRLDPSSGNPSSIDLAFTLASLTMGAAVSVGNPLGSDHLPIMVDLDASPIRSPCRASFWILDENKWTTWNSDLANSLQAKNFKSILDPGLCFSIFMQTIQASNHRHFRKSRPSPCQKPEPGRPWWDRDCNELVQAARKAQREWCKAPLSSQKRSVWKLAEAKKNRHIIRTKKKAWEDFISYLNPNGGQTKMWAFMKSMADRGSAHSLEGSAIRDPDGRINSSPEKKANVFLNMYSSFMSPDAAQNEDLDPTIRAAIVSDSPLALNSPITLDEVTWSLSKVGKSKAVRTDGIHNMMLKNQSPENKINICKFFNVLFSNAYVPMQWRQAVVLPLLKTGQPAEDKNSYRPVFLTSCLCKVFERIFAARLGWFVESKDLLPQTQAGFRKNRCTTDQSDADVKEGFCTKRSTVAVFLDVKSI